MKSLGEREPSNPFPTKVLLVEDSAGDASLVMSALNEAIDLFEVRWVTSFEAATSELLLSHYECLLVDLDLPDADGLDAVDILRHCSKN
jgi:DNA-binding response OmpR family regulator